MTENIQLKNLSLPTRLFISLILILLGINYLFLLFSIWLDTRMDIAMIIEGYRSFEAAELLEHSFKYLYWFIGAFGISVGLFLFSSHPQKVKTFFVMATPLLVLSDIGSMWAVRFSSWFAVQMYLSGFLLAVSFLALFVLLQKELWQS